MKSTAAVGLVVWTVVTMITVFFGMSQKIAKKKVHGNNNNINVFINNNNNNIFINNAMNCKEEEEEESIRNYYGSSSSNNNNTIVKKCNSLLFIKNRPNPAALLYTTAGHEHTVNSSFDDNNLAPLTKWAQSYMYQNQYGGDVLDSSSSSSSCSSSSGRQIMITHGYDSGFGSEMHVIGAMLGYALEHNHTLVLSPQACKSFVDQSTCKNGCACLFKPISNCRYNDIVIDHPNPTTISINGVSVGSTTSTTTTAVLVDLLSSANSAAVIQHTIPTVFKQALLHRLPSMSNDQMKYWWRAQSVAFLMRFNNATVDAVRRLRSDASKHYCTQGNSFFSPQNNNKQQNLLLPTGAFAIHIRGGDKHQEMTLVPATNYIDAVVRNIQNTPLSYPSRTVFVSSDDENSLTEAREYAESLSLPFVYTLMHRQKGGHSLSTWTYATTTTTGSKKITITITELFYGHLLQLIMSLEADSWIGTRASNWNRLIDELRCVWVDKCSGSYTEVGDSYDEYNW